MQDCQSKGRNIHGQDQYNSKLTDADVIEIFALRKQGWTLEDLGQKFGIRGKSHVPRILQGSRWGHLASELKARGLEYEKPNREWLTADDVRAIIASHKSGETAQDIAKQFQIQTRDVNRITRGERWTRVTGLTPRMEAA
jgi:transcriptional regulator with XRE-family HTH domain